VQPHDARCDEPHQLLLLLLLLLLLHTTSTTERPATAAVCCCCGKRPPGEYPVQPLRRFVEKVVVVVNREELAMRSLWVGAWMWVAWGGGVKQGRTEGD